MLKKIKILQKTALLGLALGTLQFCQAARCKKAVARPERRIILDQNRKILAPGIVPAAGVSQLKGIQLVQTEENSLSKKMILNFAKLKGFASSSKKTAAGTIIHSLRFDGLDENDCDFSKLGQALTQLTLQNGTIPAFSRFSLKPSVKNLRSEDCVPQLEFLLEHDPKQVFVIISQAAGQDTVEIEVYELSHLKKVACAKNSAIKYAINSINPTEIAANFSGNYLVRS